MKTVLRSGILRNGGLVLLALAAAGCPGPSNRTPAAAPTEPAHKVVIRGSNTVGEELAPRLIAAYKQEHPDIDFDLLTKGTSYGMGALMGGFCDIAGASRPPLKEELEVAQFRNVQLDDHIIGTYCVAVVVNASNPLTNLTRAQVRDVFTGAIQNWKELGGPDAPIRLYIRDPVSGTYLGFKELAMEDKPYASEQNLFTNYDGIVAAVARDTNGIGYSGFNLTHQPGIKAVAIDDIEPTDAAVNQGKYPYARALHLYTNQGKERPVAMDFIRFVQSPQGQEVLRATGDVPHS